MSNRPKVFCVGFQKTGTTSLHAALTTLGYRTAAVIGDDLSADELAKSGAKLCVEAAKRFDAVEDMPWPIFFRELDAAYPDSKFVLTVRDADGWFGSIDGHFGDRESEMQAFVYGRDAAAPRGNRQRYVDVFNRHNAAVRAHFADRPYDLLEMDLTAGDGWAELCGFLGDPVPHTPFPVKNRSADRQTLHYRLRRRVMQLFGRRLAPEQI